jgi:HD-like signal output (HDOD) protein
MTRIIFVDDETKILEGLQRMLRPERRKWEMAFAPGAAAALSMLEVSPFDVIVSDMKMPGLDGASLLKVVRERYPNMLRIILSGYTEVSAAFNAIPVAHQFLAKPCDPDALRIAIERATSLNEILNSKLLASLVGSVEQLPSMSDTYLDMQRAFQDPLCSIERLTAIIRRDPALCAKVLQLVNSAFFGTVRVVTDINIAVSRLGMNVLQTLVLSVEILRTFRPSAPIPGFSFDAVGVHCRLTSNLTSFIGGDTTVKELGLCTGLLHDVGKLLLAELAPEKFARAIAMARAEQCALFVAEENLLGVSHAEIGAYLLSMWGLPHLIVEAIAHHHRPERIELNQMDLLSSLYLANWIANDCESRRNGSSAEVFAPINDGIASRLNVADKLEGWREHADAAALELQRI